MVVHDGTVTIGSNIDKYFPEIKLSPAHVNMKPNSFSPDKLLRAYDAVESYVEDKILSLDRIVESSKFTSILSKSRKRSRSNESRSSPRRVVKKDHDSGETGACELTNVAGKLKTILNENFGLIEFSIEDGENSYCLFDTFDLYLDQRKTAAKRKVTIDKVLTDGEELVFNACKIETKFSVPWLANGVWKPGLELTPEPVSFSDISKEKLAVFEKVAETCSVMIESWSSPGTRESVPPLPRKSSCQILSENLSEIVKTETSETVDNDEEMERIIGVKLSQIKNESVRADETPAESFTEECQANDLDSDLELETSSLTVHVPNPSAPESAILMFSAEAGVNILPKQFFFNYSG